MTATEQLDDAEALMREHQKVLERAIEDRMPRAGSGMRRRGSYPVYMYTEKDQDEPPVPEDRPFQLQMSTTGGRLFFTRGRVQAGRHLVIPTIGGVVVDVSNGLTWLAGGGQVFARYRYTLDPLIVPYDWADDFVECEIVQTNLGANPPDPVLPTIGVVAGVSGSEGVAYTMLMAYDSAGRAIHYGQSSILPPDPNDDFPTEYVVFVAPQVAHIA